MKDKDLSCLLSQIINKLNRIEATVAHLKPASLDAAINALQIGADEIGARRTKLLAENARWFANKDKRGGK